MCLKAVCDAPITKMSWLFLPALTPLSYNVLCVRSRIFQLKSPQLQLFASVSCVCGGNLLTLCLFPRRGGRGQRCWAAAAASPCPPRYGCCGAAGLTRRLRRRPRGVPPAAPPLAAAVRPPRGTVGQGEAASLRRSLPVLCVARQSHVLSPGIRPRSECVSALCFGVHLTPWHVGQVHHRRLCHLCYFPVVSEAGVLSWTSALMHLTKEEQPCSTWPEVVCVWMCVVRWFE